MAAKTLPGIRAIVRQFLKDEFQSGINLVWKDDELDLYIGDCLAEISERAPYEVKETLTTTANSKDIDISSIEDLLEVDKIEYPTGSDPPNYHNASVFGTTLTMDIDNLPSAGENVYIFCHELHALTESSSTLKPQMERLLVLGVTAQAAMVKARTFINKSNLGGRRTPTDMQAWGVSRLALYREGLERLGGPKTSSSYPTA